MRAVCGDESNDSTKINAYVVTFTIPTDDGENIILHLFVVGTWQIISIVISICSLSLTAASFLFFQHEEFGRFNKEIGIREKGDNDPKLLYLIPTTVIRVFAWLYIFYLIPQESLLMDSFSQ